jgi:hypothetical protein
MPLFRSSPELDSKSGEGKLCTEFYLSARSAYGVGTGNFSRGGAANRIRNV